MELTREHIDQLVKRFSGHREPPIFYISEYEEQTSKLHDFSVREQELEKKLRLQSIDDHPYDTTCNDNLEVAQNVSVVPNSPLVCNDYNGTIYLTI